nr:phosphate acetyltransferase [Sodalis sp. CWE]
MLIPTGINVGLTSITLGIIQAIKQKGIKINIFKPIAQPRSSMDSLDATIHIVRTNLNISSSIEPLAISYVESMINCNQKDILMEKILAIYYANKLKEEIVLVEGLTLSDRYQFITALNYEIASILNAEIIFVSSPNSDSYLNQLKNYIKSVRSNFNRNVTGVIINKLNAPVNKKGCIESNFSDIFNNLIGEANTSQINLNQLIQDDSFPILGCIPWNSDLIAVRTIDIARYLNATIINEGEIRTRRVKSVIFCSSGLSSIIECFRTGLLLVTPIDRPEILISACLSAVNGVKISAVLLTGGNNVNQKIYRLCKQAFVDTGLPIFIVNINLQQVFLSLQKFNLEIPFDDHIRVENLKHYIATHIDKAWVESLLSVRSKYPRRLTPPLFRYQLTELARQSRRSIILPEGSEPRIIKAASICTKREIAHCVLLGNSNEINKIASLEGILLSENIKIIDPKIVREKYISRLVELRKNKGLTEEEAKSQLEDNITLGTLMLERGEVDGLVSGVTHTTANTIRPSLQLIKMAPGNSLVSSIFFMLLPEQVLVYGDCAINPNPTVEQLAEIAIQSANSAASFGIEPRVAMISYSTGHSGIGKDVEKVRKATRLVKEKCPKLLIDGPLQYDAAIMADVAQSKAPNSPVAGQATVFIFPDLNTGNTTYKAVQRSANLISIGPMLQGMRKPVNDLSRGALVDDIVYTIALTAIQSKEIKN